MALWARLFDLQPGATIISADLDSEFNQIINVFNGTLTTKNLLVKFSDGSDAPLSLDQLGSGLIQSWRQSGSEKLRVNNTGVLESLVTTGVAPFIVASTTKVTNLNADSLDGLDQSAFARNNYRICASVGWFYDVPPGAVETTESQGRWIVPGQDTTVALTAYRLEINYAGGSHTGGTVLTFTLRRRNAAGTLQADIGTVTLDNTNNTIQVLYSNDIADVPLTARDQIYPVLTTRTGSPTETGITVTLTVFEIIAP